MIQQERSDIRITEAGFEDVRVHMKMSNAPVALLAVFQVLVFLGKADKADFLDRSKLLNRRLFCAHFMTELFDNVSLLH